MTTFRPNRTLLQLLAGSSALTLLTACPTPLVVPAPVSQTSPATTPATGAPGATGATGATGAVGVAGSVVVAGGATGAGSSPATGATTPPTTGATTPPATTSTSAPTATTTQAPVASPSAAAAPQLAVASTSPANAAANVAVNRAITATFTKAANAGSLDAATFKVTGPATEPVKGALSYDAATNTVSFRPTNNLQTATKYTATITTGAKDQAGRGLASDVVWTFTTGTTISPEPVAMSQLLSKFAVLAGSTVTNSGPSNVTGDLGLSPGSQLVGFDVPGGPGKLNGTRHITDSIAAQAKSDLLNSFNDAKGRAGSPISVSGNLGGMTLAPGLYTSQTSLAVSSGDLTFDAKGDANAVWVLQMGSSLTTTAGRQVILAGGAKANNIFWEVGSSATFGTTSVFKGNVLAAISITMNTGSTLEGRVLTQTGAVALNASTIVLPN